MISCRQHSSCIFSKVSALNDIITIPLFLIDISITRFLDFKQTFVATDLSALIEKIESYGVGGTVIK